VSEPGRSYHEPFTADLPVIGPPGRPLTRDERKLAVMICERGLSDSHPLSKAGAILLLDMLDLLRTRA
jgi:hypothetical protein